MSSELRELITKKRQARGMAIESLSACVRCSTAELRGFEQGLFTLGAEKLCGLIKVLEVTPDELVSAVGQLMASQLQDDCERSNRHR